MVQYGCNRLRAETGEVGRVFLVKQLARHRRGFGFHSQCEEGFVLASDLYFSFLFNMTCPDCLSVAAVWRTGSKEA